MALLDKQVQAFVDYSTQFYPPDAVDASMAQQRQWYNNLCDVLRAPRPADLQVTDSLVPSSDGYQVPIRTYQVGAQASSKQVLYAHGGGFVLGGLETHDDICAEIAHHCQVDVVSVDYRLSPEYQYPCDLQDCLAVLDHLLAKGHQLVLAGDSAGGTLSACVANQRLSESGKGILGQVLIYPSLVKDWHTPSMLKHAYAPLLTREDMEYYLRIRTNGAEPPLMDPGFAPLACDNLSQLPPTHLFPAAIDPLCDDCAIYAEALQQAGVPVTNHLSLGQGLVHCYLRARRTSDKARQNFAAICHAISQLLV